MKKHIEKKDNKIKFIIITLVILIAVLAICIYNYMIAKNNTLSATYAIPENALIAQEVSVEEPEDEFIDIDELENDEISEESEQENVDSGSDTKSNTSNTRFFCF